ncbi:MAG: hypothetical protein Kow0013_02850 [Pararhodobacter sp.]
MKTDDLIAALAADTMPQAAPAARLWRGLPAAALVSLVALVVLWRVRPELDSVLTSYPVYKTAVPAVLALAALWLGLALGRPGVAVRAPWVPLLAVLSGLGGALIYGLTTTSSAEVAALIDTPDYTNCLISIPVLAALPLAVTLWAMRAGAPAHPALSGALAGTVAAGIGAAVYSLHCPNDALMYFFSAYGTSMLTVVAAGALIGARLLRW